jgi:hypothetical protein
LIDLFKDLAPEELAHNLRFRMQVLKEASRGKCRAFRQGLIELCRRSFTFWVNNFVWQFNPKKDSDEAAGPFVLWDYQHRAAFKEPGVPWPGEDEDDLHDCGLFHCIENSKSVVIQKSRELGISWFCLLIFTWYTLFHNNRTFLCVSHNEHAVDDPSPDSLFWKIEFIIRHLPSWMARLASEHGSGMPITRNSCFFGNKKRNSSITGQATTARIGVGGRATAILLDEFALVRDDKKVRERTAGTSDCRIFNSTHQGMDTQFYELTHNTPEVPRLTIHWTQHPEKKQGLYRSGSPVQVIDKTYVFPADYKFDQSGEPQGGIKPGLRSPYYDKQCVAIGSKTGIAKELDVNPSGSVAQVFDARLINELIRAHCREPFWEGEMSRDNERLAYSPGGRIKLWCNLDNDLPPVGRYGAGVDVSLGSGSTPSCLSVASADTGEKLLEAMTSDMSAHHFAFWCKSILMLWKDAAGQPPLLVWEKLGIGISFSKAIIETGYRRFYYDRDETALAGNRPDSVQPGFVQTPKNQLALFEDYKRALLSREFLNKSDRAMLQCLAWRYNKNGYPTFAGTSAQTDDPSGARDHHGDLTVADALCSKMLALLGMQAQQKPTKELAMTSMQWRRNLKQQQDAQQSEWVR